MNDLITLGLIIGSKQIIVRRLSFVCDASAFSFILKVKNHGGFWCCRKCYVQGERAWKLREWDLIKDNKRDDRGLIQLKKNDPPGRLAYPDITAKARANSSFRSQSDTNYHSGLCISILANGIVRSVSIRKSFRKTKTISFCVLAARRQPWKLRRGEEAGSLA